MTSYQNALDYVRDQMQLGNISSDEANVLIVQMMGIMVIKGRIPSQVRKALNAAVKAGELGRLKKDGLKPEIYHHKNARAKAIGEQKRIFKISLDALKSIYA